MADAVQSHLRSVQAGLNLSNERRALLSTQRGILKALSKSPDFQDYSFISISGCDPKAPNFAGWPNGQPGHVIDPRDGNIPIAKFLDDERYDVCNAGLHLSHSGPLLEADIDTEHADLRDIAITALKLSGVDTRLGFGRLSAGMPSKFLFRLDPNSVEHFTDLYPFIPTKQAEISGKKIKIELRRSRKIAPPKGHKTIPQDPKRLDVHKSETEGFIKSFQTVMPGSVYNNKSDGGRDDVSVFWRNDNGAWKAAERIDQLMMTTFRHASFKIIIRAVFTAHFVMAALPIYHEGSRQDAMRTLAGWLERARFRFENDKWADYLPISTQEDVEHVIGVLCALSDDPETWMRLRTARDAANKLEAAPRAIPLNNEPEPNRLAEAIIAGRPKLRELVGDKEESFLNYALNPTADDAELDELIERYYFSEGNNKVIDTRATTHGDLFIDPKAFETKLANVVRFIDGKPVKGFPLWKSDPLRVTVRGVTRLSDQPHGIIHMIRGRTVKVGTTGSTPFFNYNSGLEFEPPEGYAPDPDLAADCDERRNRWLGYITNDNAVQAEHIDARLADIAQNPASKIPVAIYVVGGQGIGKTFIGTYAEAIFGDMVGVVDGGKLGERFGPSQLDTPISIIDEVRLSSIEQKTHMKKVIRNEAVRAERKGVDFGLMKTPRLVIFLGNKLRNLSEDDMASDRAFYIIYGVSPETAGLSKIDFNKRMAGEPQQFYGHYAEFLKRDDVRAYETWRLLNKRYDAKALREREGSSNVTEAVIEVGLSWGDQFQRDILRRGFILEPGDWTQTEKGYRPVSVDMLMESIVKWSRNFGSKGNSIVPNDVFNALIEAKVVEYTSENSRIVSVRAVRSRDDEIARFENRTAATINKIDIGNGGKF